MPGSVRCGAAEDQHEAILSKGLRDSSASDGQRIGGRLGEVSHHSDGHLSPAQINADPVWKCATVAVQRGLPLQMSGCEAGQKVVDTWQSRLECGESSGADAKRQDDDDRMEIRLVAEDDETGPALSERKMLKIWALNFLFDELLLNFFDIFLCERDSDQNVRM